METNVSQNLLQDDFRKYLPLYGVLARLSVNLTQPFHVRQADDGTRAGPGRVNVAEAAFDGARGDVAVNIIRAYFGLKVARAALDTVKEGHDRLVQWIKTVDREIESGRGAYTEIDLMRLKVTESQLQFNLVDAERIINSALAAVRYLAQDGWPMSTTVTSRSTSRKA